ncbi:MAG: amidohydrolase family protein, partial [Spirochaetota bacterium]
MDDLLFTNVRVITMDDSMPRAEAVFVSGDRIKFVGSAREASQFVQASGAGKNLSVIDLKGKTLVPGFNDDHVHLLAGADHLMMPDLSGKSGREIVDFLKSRYQDARPGDLISGSGWDYTACRDPDKKLLDNAFPENPVVLLQYSGHGAWVNSLVLKQLKIDSSTPDPDGGRILRDSNNEPTGILQDMAATPLHTRRFMEMNFNKQVRRKLLDSALQMFRENGITSVQDNTWVPFTAGEYVRYARMGSLTLRISCWSLGIKPFLAAWMELKPFHGTWVRQGPRKYFLDGTFSTKTAWLKEAYNGEDANFGMPYLPLDKLSLIVTAAARAKRQIAFHAIGDKAVHELVNTVEKASERYPAVTGLRLRVEHAQLISPEDLPRIKTLGLVISAQPSALVSPEKDGAILGSERSRAAYPFRS